MEEGYNVDVIYLDFAKAFDKLDLNIALQKLFNLGIRGKVLAWIECFLKGRKQQVVVNGAKSEPVDAGLEIRGGHASWPPQWPPPDSPTVAKNGHRNWAKSG